VASYKVNGVLAVAAVTLLALMSSDTLLQIYLFMIIVLKLALCSKNGSVRFVAYA